MGHFKQMCYFTRPPALKEKSKSYDVFEYFFSNPVNKLSGEINFDDLLLG